MICSWAHLPSSLANMLANAFSTPTKWQTQGTQFPFHFSKQFQCLLTCPKFHMSPYNGIPSDHVTWWHLMKTLWASSMLQHMAYMSTRLHPTKTSESQPPLNYLLKFVLAASAEAGAGWVLSHVSSCSSPWGHWWIQCRHWAQ
jgi:hypothetical protein